MRKTFNARSLIPNPERVAAERIARKFHEAYERLAPQFGYKTREESAKPWNEVPENNRNLMIAVCEEISREAYAGEAKPQADPVCTRCWQVRSLHSIEPPYDTDDCEGFSYIPGASPSGELVYRKNGIEISSPPITEAESLRARTLKAHKDASDELVRVLSGLLDEMRAEVSSKSTGILHESATNYWADRLDWILTNHRASAERILKDFK